MAVDRKISDLNPYPGDGKPQGGDLFVSAREDNSNFKIPFSGLSRFGAEFARSVFATGDQTINGVKTFNEFILGDVSGNLSGTAKYVEHGVYVTGDQTIDGAKNFLIPITGNLSGMAQFVRDGVYVTGDQTIDGTKTFNSFIVGNVSGNLSGTARHTQDAVYVTGDQLINGNKTFINPISGNLSGVARYVQDAVYITGNQEIGGNKTFTNPISGNISGFSRYVNDGVYITGDQNIDGDKNFVGDLLLSGTSILSHIKSNSVLISGNQSISGIKTFDSFIVGNVSGNLSGTAKYVEHGVYTTGDQTITGEKNFVGGLFLSGSPVLTQETFGSSIENIVYTTGSQLISGQKTFHDEIIPTGGIISANNKPLKFSDGRNIDLFDNPGNSLSLIFESGVYITGGVGGNLADLHVEGSIFANQIDALSEIVGESGSMVFTDGRDPALFEGPDNSLTMAFENGVYITGGVGGELADLHVEGTIFATQIDALNEIVGESGSMVFTDGRDPALFEGPDNSLSMAFSSGVYITGQDPSEANLYVQGSGTFKSLRADELHVDNFTVGKITETVKTQRDYIHTHFVNDLAGLTNFYIPLHAGEGTIKENNQPFATQGHTLLCPHSGRLKKVMMRARGGSLDPGRVIMFVCTGKNNINANSDVIEVEEVEILGTDRVNTYSFDFTGDNHFVEGSAMLLKANFERSTSNIVNITAEVEYTYLNT